MKAPYARLQLVDEPGEASPSSVPYVQAGPRDLSKPPVFDAYDSAEDIVAIISTRQSLRLLFSFYSGQVRPRRPLAVISVLLNVWTKPYIQNPRSYLLTLLTPKTNASSHDALLFAQSPNFHPPFC